MDMFRKNTKKNFSRGLWSQGVFFVKQENLLWRPMCVMLYAAKNLRYAFSNHHMLFDITLPVLDKLFFLLKGWRSSWALGVAPFK